MKNKFLKATAAGIVFSISAISSIANAGLIDRGNGMIYDDVLDITWLQDANLANTTMNWNDSVAWAAALEFGGYDDWRLTNVYDVGADGCNLSNGGTDCGYNSLTSYTDPNSGEVFFSELAYMYYENLGNVAYTDPNGVRPQPGWDSLNTSFVDAQSGDTVSFIDLGRDVYWSGNGFAPDISRAWYVSTYSGGQHFRRKVYNFHVWAVRDGDVTATVPEPSTIGIFGLAMIGLVLRKRP